MRNKIKAVILATLLPLSLLAQGGVTEPGATEPNSLATTTYDNPTGPNHAPGGPHRAAMEEGITGNFDDSPEGGTQSEHSPIGAPWILLGFAAAYAAYRLVRRKGVKD